MDSIYFVYTSQEFSLHIQHNQINILYEKIKQYAKILRIDHFQVKKAKQS